MSRQLAIPLAAPRPATPAFELVARKHGAGDLALQIVQVPTAATPQRLARTRLGGLRGARLELIESRILKRLGEHGRRIAQLRPGQRLVIPLEEAEATRLALLFRTLAPMRAHAAMLACAQLIEGLSREEAAWWLGMVLHRRRPRRVLAALRLLAEEP